MRFHCGAHRIQLIFKRPIIGERAGTLRNERQRCAVGLLPRDCTRTYEASWFGSSLPASGHGRKIGTGDLPHIMSKRARPPPSEGTISALSLPAVILIVLRNAYQPPSMWIFWPVIMSEAGETRKSTRSATFSGWIRDFRH